MLALAGPIPALGSNKIAKAMKTLCPLESICVFAGYFRDRLPNGSYVEWLESLGAPVRKLGFYAGLRVNVRTISPFEEIWYFHVWGDDCTLASYEFNTHTQKLVCTSPFVDDDELDDLTDEAFNARLSEFCKKFHLTAKYNR